MCRRGDGSTRATVIVPTSRGRASITRSIAPAPAGSVAGSTQWGSWLGGVVMAELSPRSPDVALQPDHERGGRPGVAEQPVGERGLVQQPGGDLGERAGQAALPEQRGARMV